MTRNWTLVALSLLSSACYSTDAAAQKSFSVYHSLNGKDFEKRGSVVLEVNKEEDGLTIDVNNEVTMDATSVEKMLSTGLYQVKIVDEKTKDTVMASVSACQVRRANFRDEISLTLGPTGKVLSVSYAPLVSPLAPSCENMSPVEDGTKFHSKVNYETATPGMTVPLVLPQVKPPPGLKWFPRKAGDGGGNRPPGQGGGEQDKQQPQGLMGWLMKYWYIVLPLMIMNLLTAPPEEPPQQGQQQQQGRTPQAGGGGAQQQQQQRAAPSPGGTTARRGKRG